VVGHVETALAAAGLPPLAWYDVLWALRRAPRRRLRLSELAEAVTLSRGGLTKLVDRLEEDGLLRREPAPEDGRGLYAVLTPAGVRTLRAMWPVYASALRESFAAAIGVDEARVIAEALNRPLA
jgi:DNA-binding MarR family transcriptional regulator